MAELQLDWQVNEGYDVLNWLKMMAKLDIVFPKQCVDIFIFFSCMDVYISMCTYRCYICIVEHADMDMDIRYHRACRFRY